LTLNSYNKFKASAYELIVSKEARDVNYLKSIFDLDKAFMKYQYALVALKSSVYNNLTLLYRHWERVNVVLMLTVGMKKYSMLAVVLEILVLSFLIKVKMLSCWTSIHGNSV
jgi:hypothetical protein